jgi:hypothetical protein
MFAPLFMPMETNLHDESMGSTNIRVDTETRDRIARLGTYDDTADTILRRVLDFYEKEAPKKKQ